MITLDIDSIAKIINGKKEGPNKTILAINTDSRQNHADSLFFALKGDRFDAHEFLEQAVKSGAVALVVEQFNKDIQLPQIIVENTKVALGLLAKWIKSEIKPITIAITGSTGKTTVKEMTAAILREKVGDAGVLYTQGNLNNEIGVPLTLLRLNRVHKFAVIEAGASHKGEILYTTHLIQPDIALVNNISAAHVEGFGSLEEVASAKSEIYAGLSKQGIVVMNLDADYLSTLKMRASPYRIKTFATNLIASDLDDAVDYYASDIQVTESGSNFLLYTPGGKVTINLPYLGKHNVSNALAATALAMEAGADLEQVKQGLEKKSAIKGRLFPISVNEQLLLLDDTYNASVNSVIEGIKVLQHYSAFRILVVADMAELGANSLSFHQQIADFTHQSQIDAVYSYGKQSALISAACDGEHYVDKKLLIAHIIKKIEQQLKQKNKVVLLAKGSRSMKMEEVIYSLKEYFLC